MNESQFKVKVKAALKKCPDLYPLKISDRYTSGIPDFIICSKGIYVGLELKVDTREVTPLQVHVGHKIVEAGGRFIVLRWLNKTSMIDVVEYNKEEFLVEKAQFSTLEHTMMWLNLREEWSVS